MDGTGPSTSASLGAMLVQVTTDGGVPKLHCPVCNKALGSLAGYVKHLKKHEPPGGFKCRHCNSLFCQEDELKKHVEATHAELTCNLCHGMSFVSSAALCSHINEVHPDEDREKHFKFLKFGLGLATEDSIKSDNATRSFKCDICDKSLPTRRDLKQHQETVHKTGPGRRRGFAEKNERTHNATPSALNPPVRKVECKGCNATYSSSSNLMKHRRSRPDTCGLPIYDTCTQRGRPRGSRSSNTLDSSTAAKIKAKAKKTRKKHGSNSSSDGGDDFMDNDNVDSSDDDLPLANRLKTRGQQMKQEPISTAVSDSDEEYPDFEPTNSDDDDFKLPAPAKVKEETYDDDFEYQDASLFVQSTCAVKEEGTGSEIFINEKDKLLDVLLSTEEDGVVATGETNLKPFESLKVEHAMLDEIAAVPLAATNEPESVEEDVLALQEPASPEDNDDDDDDDDDEDFEYDSEAEKKSKRKKQSKAKASKPTGPKRKYRKRNAPRTPSPSSDSQMPKRVAKISKKELKERLKMINKVEKSWKCPHCVKIYHIRKPYEKHLRDDHKLTPEQMKEIFKDVDAHAKLDEEVFKCKICSKIYLVEKRLETHMKVHGEDGSLTFKCPCYCNLFFATKEEATAHAHKQHKELLYCVICDKYMTGHDSLKNHEKNFHSKKQPRNQPRNLICDKCGKKFTGRTSLSDHVRSDCGRLPLYQCSVCSKRLSTAGILKTHMLLHKDETPYQCDKCGKTFKVKAQYKSHLKTRHTDYKPYKCHLCPKEYPYRESLLTHMTVHTGIKRFLCNNCGKRFTCISNLQAHRKVHADTCGLLPLNAKATQYMGVQRGKLLMGAKPEAGMEYEETKTLIAQDVIDRDMPMAQELNFPSEPSAPLATVPLNYASSHLVPHIVLQTMQAEARRSSN